MYGIDGFVQTVLHIITTQPVLFADHWIGSFPLAEPPVNLLHDVRMSDPLPVGTDRELLVVKIRLFAYLEGTPSYFVVAGHRPKA